MQTCYNCGREVPDGTLICPECGALVRRYTDAPKPEPEQPAVQPVMRQAAPAGQVGVRFRGFLKVWLIVLIVLSSYLLLNCVASIFIVQNSDAILASFREPGMEEFAEIAGSLEELLNTALEALPLFYVLGFLYACKLVCHIRLLRTRRRKSFYFSAGVSVAAMLGLLVLGGGGIAVLYFLDPLVTWLGLRLYWPEMEN